MTKENNKETGRRAGRMLMKTDRLHRKAFEAQVWRLGLHRSQHIMLMHLAKDSEMSQKALAQHLEISPAAVAVTLKKLESGGYIEKKTAENDCRFNEIVITEKGLEVVNASKSFFADVDEAMVEGIDEKTLESFFWCLERMQKNLLALEAGENKEEKL